MEGGNGNEAANQPVEDFAGRKDLADLKQAYRASGDEARRLAAENAALKAMQAAVTPRPEIAQRDPYRELEEYGLANPVREVIQREIGKAFEPIAHQIQGQQQARQHMLANYGKDFIQFEQDVAQD